MTRPLLFTPAPIKAKAMDLLRQLNGLSYADAVYALDVAKRAMDDAVDRLQAEQVFTPPAFQHSPPTDSADRP